MARKKQTHQQKKASEMEWGGFIDLRLTQEEKDRFAEWAASPDCNLQLDVQEALGAGLKLGVSYDSENDFYLATYTGAGLGMIGIDLRCCLTARAPEYSTAIALLNFKHFTLCECNWGDFRPSTGRMDRFG